MVASLPEAIAAAILRGRELYNESTRVASSLRRSHSAWTALQRLSLDIPWRGLDASAAFIWPQIFSIILKSGDWGGHSKTAMLSYRSRASTFFEVCTGERSCWNTGPAPEKCTFASSRWATVVKISQYLFAVNLPSILTRGPRPSFVIMPQTLTVDLPLFETLCKNFGWYMHQGTKKRTFGCLDYRL